MPELSDLQVFSRNLTKRLSGKKIKTIRALKAKKLNVSQKKLQDTLEGQVIKSVERDGKELHIHFKSGDVLGLHLMLRGKLHLFEVSHEHKFVVLEILFNDDTGIVMTDFQGQATPTLNPASRDTIDALSEELNAAFLHEQFKKSKAAIKNFLLDQHNIRGIGNAYVDEILWESGISPFSISNKIPEKNVKALAKAIKTVLKEAEKNIVKSHPDIISGEVRDFLKIHNAKKTHSPTGGKILIDKAGGRKTYYTEEQELFK